MNITTILIGAVALAYGLYTVYLRQAKPEKLGKLDAMREAWGEQGGYALHLVSYSIVPAVFGASTILAGLRGVAFF